ncbi:hypothetical protein [Pelagimonas varians]|uniref:zinc ribbon domain-containing protein n=1 Tax=Pelagimonas varians TaxID=696760 RepID=UPI003CCC7AA4
MRGTLECESCGYGITSCWSTSGTKRKYPYYFCHHKGCPEHRKSTRREEVEKQFENQLKSLVPSRNTHALAARMFKDAWEQRAATVGSEARRLRKRADQKGQEIEAMLDRIVRTSNDVTVAAYENRISELQSEMALFEEEAQKLSKPHREFDEMFELAMRFLSNPYEIWKKGNLTAKKTVLRLVCPTRLRFDRKRGPRPQKRLCLARRYSFFPSI